MPPDWVFISIAIILGLLWIVVKSALKRRSYERQLGRELDEPFFVEVLYQGKPIADLSNRKFIGMFWRDYRITPRSPAAKEIIDNDNLWDECVFYFRDPISGDISSSGFVGGERPFIRDGKISLRALYFGGSADASEESRNS